jgi:radical SAM protein with 4Fe4S-binding SPASM domain
MMQSVLFQNIEIETLSVCNLRCGTCPVSLHPRKPLALGEAAFRRVVDELASVDYAGTFSPHFYNEPFADSRLPELMRYAADRLPRAALLIFTNTTLLTRDLFEKMPAAIREYLVTVDEEAIRLSFERLMRELTPEQQRKFRARSIAQNGLFSRGGSVQLPGLKRVKACSIPSQYCIINAAGDVLLCYNDYFCKSVLGNINDTPLLEIWNAPANVKLREEAAAGAFQGEPCAQCESNVPQEAL